MRKIIEAVEINEIKKIPGYTFVTNLNSDELEEYRGFIKDTENFAKKMLHMMGDPNNEGLGSLSMIVDISNLVNSSLGTSITFYGWDKFSTEDEFERLWNKNSMQRYITDLLPNRMKGYNSIHVSTYWTAKRTIGYKKINTIQTGPYVEITYDNDKIID